ncbi:ABC transporter permease [Virgibacillus indicus]|uniref:ABC transporter permease n=1 Tax=Virgibacillus indicus TaxID=2024554 RepID=A0A265N7K0_9BACI|nr:ABC transporter permease [Virgibacillus indicus]OZU87771.1 ABC transporter permease [Virgibacillus indicus]
MTFIQFAFNNVKRNTRAYLSYFLSCMFSVMVFFMYAVAVFHPDIAEYEFRDIVQRGIIASEVIIYGFSFLFVLYSTGSFIKSRKKEYGLLTTLGISKTQLNFMLILENTIIGIASIAAGIVAGALLTKAFLMFFTIALGLEDVLPFYLSFKAIGLTALLFFIMFELNTIAVIWTLRTKSIMDVFRGSKSPKKVPRFSWILSVLSLAAIGTAYYLAYTADWITIFSRMFSILFFIIPGTYFLFTQFSIAFTNGLKFNKNYYYRKLNMLTTSDLTFKLRDNSRLLFFVTILSAVSFTSSGVMYGLFQSAAEEAEHFSPQDVTLIGQGEDNRKTFLKEVNYVEERFKKEGITYQSMLANSVGVQGYSDVSEWNDLELLIYSYSDYKKMVEMNGEKVDFKPAEHEVYLLIPELLSSTKMNQPENFSFVSKNNNRDFIVKTAESGINSNIYTNYPYIVADEIFEQYYQAADDDEIYYNYVMDIPNWVNYAEEITEITSHENFEIARPDSQANFYVATKEGMSYLFFFGIFISVLFFLAAGSILYFRMYQDIDNDLKHFHSLYRIGLTDKEMKKIATKELGLLFFIPFFAAVIHAAFAFKALQNLLSSSITIPSIIVISIYFIVHFANFLFIRNIYTAKLKKVM